jgi:pSer/pThr/pTyr-binding forkhead associated (FHA) protein
MCGTARIELEDRPEKTVPLGELVRIGRSEDCDLSIASLSLAEMHAVIHRSPESDFVIFDVSDNADAGLSVNGVLSRRHRLSDGDCIELGHQRVIFRVGPRRDHACGPGVRSGHAVE